MLDQLFARFRRTLPWAVRIDPTAARQARQAIDAAYLGAPERARENAIRNLEDYLRRLEHDPLEVLGHPPLGTNDANVFRYTSDPQATISVVADLDLTLRQLRVVRIVIKTGDRHGR